MAAARQSIAEKNVELRQAANEVGKALARWKSAGGGKYRLSEELDKLVELALEELKDAIRDSGRSKRKDKDRRRPGEDGRHSSERLPELPDRPRPDVDVPDEGREIRASLWRDYLVAKAAYDELEAAIGAQRRLIQIYEPRIQQLQRSIAAECAGGPSN